MEQLSLFSETQEFKGIPVNYPDITFVKANRTREFAVFEGDDYYKVCYKNKAMFVFGMKPSGCEQRPIAYRFESIKTYWSLNGWGTHMLVESLLNRRIKSEMEELEGASQ